MQEEIFKLTPGMFSPGFLPVLHPEIIGRKPEVAFVLTTYYRII
jgi:hypothetical protein